MTYSLTLSHAVAVTLFTAYKVRQGFFEFAPAREIAAQLNIKGPTLVKILQSLTRAGILESREGAKGGVRLARDAGDVRILDVLEAMENRRPLFRTDMEFATKGEIPDRANAAIRKVFEDATVAMNEALASKTIESLMSALGKPPRKTKKTE